MAELIVGMDKKEYLKKYLSGDIKTEKKKLKVKNSRKIQSRFKIVDEDIDIKSLETTKDAEDEEIGDEAPAVAEIIDERPEDIKLNELYKSTHWKKLEETVTEIKQEEPEHQQTLASDFIMKPKEEINNLNINTRHDSSSDLSPSRQTKCSLEQSDSDLSPPRQRIDNDTYQRIEHTTRSNLSNIRQAPTSKNYSESDSDLSPPRQNRTEFNSGKIYKNELTSTHLSPKKPLKHSIKTRLNSDHEVSPHRQKHRTSIKVAYDSSNNKSPEMKIRYAQSRTKHKQSVGEKSSSIMDKYDSDHSPLRVREKTSTEKSKHKSNKYATVKKHDPQKTSKKYSNSDCNFSLVRKHSKNDIAFERYKSGANNDSFSLKDSCREIYTEKEMNKQYSKIDNSPSPSRHFSSSRLPDTHFGRKSESNIQMPKVEMYEEEVNSLRKRHKMNHIHRKNKNIVKLYSSEEKKCKDSIDGPKHQYSNIKKARYDSDSDLSSPHHSQDFKEYGSTESKYAAQQSKVQHKVPKLRYPSERNRHQASGTMSESNSSSSEQEPKRLKTHDKTRKHTESGMESSQKDFKSSRPTYTLSGMKAGLQDALLRSLKEETSDMRKRELNMLYEMGDDLSGRTAETVVRDRATGLKRDLKEERRKQKDDEAKKSKQQEKYMEWGKGLKQKEEQKSRLNEHIYEMSKPLARYRDDEDLERQLKETERQGDPMLDYIRKKKRKSESVTASLPVYSGPPAPPNRFGINPGYRWDGVDRSNGFERKLFESKSKKKAQEEEAYSWSVQNM